MRPKRTRSVLSKLLVTSAGSIMLFAILIASAPSSHATGGMISDGPSCTGIGGTWSGTSNTCTVTSLTVNSGDVLTIASKIILLNTGDITNSGKISLDVAGFISNSGTINNNAGGIINNTVGIISNNQAGIVSNSGLINNYAILANSGTINNNPGGLLNNTGIINSNQGGTINNSGIIRNNPGGVINSVGIINNNSGGNIINYNVGSINNLVGGTINNNSGGTINNNSGGVINNFGLIYNYCGATFTNNGTISGNQVQNICSTATTSILSNANPSAPGQSVTFTATVSPSSATGTVQFKIDGTNFGSPSNLSGGTAISSSTSTLSIGSHTITGVYSGDGTYTTSNGTLIQMVLRITSSKVTPNPSSMSIGMTNTFTAKVNDTSSGTKTNPSSTVSWSDGGAGGSFNATTCTLVPSQSSTAKSTCGIEYTQPQAAGPVTINATYSGDSTHKTSSGASAVTINLRLSSTSVEPNPSSISIGRSNIFTAKVNDTSSGTKTNPSSTVSWSDGGAGGSFNATTCTLVPSQSSTAKSTCSIEYTPPQAAGPVTINATYSGDSTHKTSSGTSAVTINLRHTHTTVTPNPSSVVHGNNITFHVTVADTSSDTKSAPTGEVSWSDGSAGGQFASSSCILATASSSTSTCTIVYTAPSSTGSFAITGNYMGDSSHKTSFDISPLTVS